ncbi:MAG: hypothetical protein MUF61_00185 [archaeon]|jgi:hypothetical protein|nr:hypothetical protein [archaeon]
MVSKLTTGKIQVWAGGILAIFSIAGIIGSSYAISAIGSLRIFERSTWAVLAVLAVMLMLEGLANISEL